jgi:hypothetical protein
MKNDGLTMEQRIKKEIAEKSTVIHRVVKIVDHDGDAERGEILYVGRDRQKARQVYHSVICKPGEVVCSDVVFDAGGSDFQADMIVPTFSVKWSGW